MAFDAIHSSLITPTAGVSVAYSLLRNKAKTDPAFLLRGPFDSSRVLGLIHREKIEVKLTSSPHPGGDAQCFFTSPEEVKHVRKQYKDIRKEFVEAAEAEIVLRWKNEILPEELLARIAGYNIHHKKPIWLSGDNSFDNLILIDHTLHKSIHKEMKRVFKKLIRLFYITKTLLRVHSQIYLMTCQLLNAYPLIIWRKYISISHFQKAKFASPN